MLEQISNLVREHGLDTVVTNEAIPNEENNAVLAEATTTITSGLQNMLAGGGLQDIISMFTGGTNNSNNSQRAGGLSGILKNPMVTMMIGHLVSKLISKHNMSPDKASSVANNLIPNVINDLVTRTNNNDPSNDAFDLDDLIGSLTGGAGGFNLQDILGKLTRGNAGDANTGGFDLQDIIKQVTQATQQNKAGESGKRGIADIIKGLFN